MIYESRKKFDIGKIYLARCASICNGCLLLLYFFYDFIRIVLFAEHLLPVSKHCNIPNSLVKSSLSEI